MSRMKSACVCVSLRARASAARMYARERVSVCVCVCVRAPTWVCTCACVGVCARVRARACVCARVCDCDCSAGGGSVVYNACCASLPRVFVSRVSCNVDGECSFGEDNDKMIYFLSLESYRLKKTCDKLQSEAPNKTSQHPDHYNQGSFRILSIKFPDIP